MESKAQMKVLDKLVGVVPGPSDKWDHVTTYYITLATAPALSLVLQSVQQRRGMYCMEADWRT